MILHMAWVQGDIIWSQICRYPNQISREEDTLNYFIFYQLYISKELELFRFIFQLSSAKTGLEWQFQNCC